SLAAARLRPRLPLVPARGGRRPRGRPRRRAPRRAALGPELARALHRGPHPRAAGEACPGARCARAGRGARLQGDRAPAPGPRLRAAAGGPTLEGHDEEAVSGVAMAKLIVVEGPNREKTF